MGDKYFTIVHVGASVEVRDGADGTVHVLTAEEALELGAELTTAAIEAHKVHRERFEASMNAQVDQLVQAAADRRAEKVTVRS